MRLSLTLPAAALLIASSACGRFGESGRAARAGGPQNVSPANGIVASLASSDLQQFAPLPPTFAPLGNQPTDAQVVLGRRLWYETALSEAHDVSCNSCHPLHGYGADGHRVPYGDRGQAGLRNTPSIYNDVGQVSVLSPDPASSVEELSLKPIVSPTKMGMPSAQAVEAHLRSDATYRDAFRAAYPGEAEPVTYRNLGRALGAFERGLVTPSRWDRYLRGDTTALTAAEKRGVKSFVVVGCAACHGGTYVGGETYQKLGLVNAFPSKADSGRFTVSGQRADLFVFKIPSLRNVDKTGPYFHDGSVTSLEHAVQLMGEHQLGVALAEVQVRDIVTWMGALTGELPVPYIAEHPAVKGQR